MLYIGAGAGAGAEAGAGTERSRWSSVYEQDQNQLVDSSRTVGEAGKGMTCKLLKSIASHSGL